MNEKRLVRSRDDRMIFGVAAGIAHYLNIDPVIIRLLFVLLTLGGGHGILIYLILALIMREEPAMEAKGNAFDPDEIIVGKA